MASWKSADYRRIKRLIVHECWLFIIFVAIGFVAAAAEAVAIAPDKPHIILIMFDDLDYYDVGAYGSPDIKTQNIDQVARSGMRFERFYSSGPVCSPTRVAMLTGQHPATLGVLRAISNNSVRGIPSTVPTLPALLQRSGYHTVHLGKWHVGTNAPAYVPTSKGFDRSFRYDGRGYLNPSLVVDDQREESYRGRHLTSVLTDLAIAELRDSLDADPNRPVFLNLWHFAPHNPVQLPADFDNRETGYCLEGGSGCDRRRARFAALVTHADREIGRLLDAIDEFGIAERTLLIITSDNGGIRATHKPSILPGRPIAGYKGSMFEGAIRVPLVARWPGRIAPGTQSSAVVSSVDFVPTLLDIAGVSDEGLQLSGRSFREVLEGGMVPLSKTSLIWENKPGNEGTLDFSGATNSFAVRAGSWKLIHVPARRAGQTPRRSLYNVDSDPRERRDLLAWKPVASVDGAEALGYRLGPIALYRAGVSDPSNQYAVLVDQLEATYWRWRRDTGVIPYQLGEHVVTRGAAGILELAGKSITASFDERLNFSEGDGSLLVAVRPSIDSLDKGTIAECPGSWRLFLDNRHVVVEIEGDPAFKRVDGGAGQVRLQSQAIDADQWHHLAMTVYGFRNDTSVVRLYLNGRAVAESGPGNTIAAVQPGRDADNPHILLGNDDDERTPFAGQMTRPTLYVRSLYASEIMAHYAEWSANRIARTERRPSKSRSLLAVRRERLTR